MLTKFYYKTERGIFDFGPILGVTFGKKKILSCIEVDILKVYVEAGNMFIDNPTLPVPARHRKVLSTRSSIMWFKINDTAVNPLKISYNINYRL
jgi:hypothetical protein